MLHCIIWYTITGMYARVRIHFKKIDRNPTPHWNEYWNFRKTVCKHLQSKQKFHFIKYENLYINFETNRRRKTKQNTYQ